MAVLLTVAFPVPVGSLLVSLPLAFVFAEFALTGRTSRLAARVVGSSISFLVIARFFDADACLDSGGRYEGYALGCDGGFPVRGLMLQGGGALPLWAVALALTAVVTIVGSWLYNRLQLPAQSKRAS